MKTYFVFVVLLFAGICVGAQDVNDVNGVSDDVSSHVVAREDIVQRLPFLGVSPAKGGERVTLEKGDVVLNRTGRIILGLLVILLIMLVVYIFACAVHNKGKSSPKKYDEKKERKEFSGLKKECPSKTRTREAIRLAYMNETKAMLQEGCLPDNWFCFDDIAEGFVDSSDCKLIAILVEKLRATVERIPMWAWFHALVDDDNCIEVLYRLRDRFGVDFKSVRDDDGDDSLTAALSGNEALNVCRMLYMLELITEEDFRDAMGGKALRASVPAAPVSSGGKKVLFAGSKPRQDLILAGLREAGFKISSSYGSNSSADVIKEMNSVAFDVVLCDIASMGIPFISDVKGRDAAAKVLALLNVSGQEAAAREAGANECCGRTLDAPSMKRVIDSMLG